MDITYGKSAIRLVKAQAYAKRNPGGPSVLREYIEAQPWIDKREILTATKAAVSGIESGDFGDALSGVPISDDFVAALRPVSVFERLGGREVPFHVRTITGGTGAVAYWVGRGKAIPLSRSELAGEAMSPKVVASLTVTTNELLANPGAKAEERLRQDVVNATAEAIDGALLDPTNAGNDNTPGSITNGITPIVSTGSTLAAIDADLQAMIDELVAAGSNLLAAKFVMNSRTATYLSLLRGTGGAPAYPDITVSGGTIAGIPVVTGAGVPVTGSPGNETSITLLDTGDFVYGEDGATVSLSSQAMIEMSSTPTGNTSTPAAATQFMASMFQEECSAIKAVRRVNWAMRRATISVLTGVDY